MHYSKQTQVSLAVLCIGLASCGASDASLATTSSTARTALGNDPAGKVSVIAAAAALLPTPEAGNDDSEAPPPDCGQALARYNAAFNQVNGMVEWHGLYRLDAYQVAGAAANAANEQNCSPSLRRTEKDCSELLSAFDAAFESLRQSPQYQSLNVTVEWHDLLVAYQSLKAQSCVE